MLGYNEATGVEAVNTLKAHEQNKGGAFEVTKVSLPEAEFGPFKISPSKEICSLLNGDFCPSSLQASLMMW